MNEPVPAVWTALTDAPLLWLVVTIAAYVGAARIQQAFRGHPLCNAVLVAIVIVAAILLVTRVSYERYLSGAQFINFLLGPATVALSVPLARNLHHVRRSLHGIGLALVLGSVTSIISSVGLVWVLGGSRAVALSVAPKAVTTPIAMAISAQIGGIPSLTAALAIIGGIVAAMIGQRMLHGMRIVDWRAHGLAAGVAGSGVAAAHVARRDGLAAAFAALGIALNGLVTACILPFVPLLWPR